MFQRMFSIQLVKTTEKPFISLGLINQIQTGLVKCHRVIGCKDANVVDIRF